MNLRSTYGQAAVELWDEMEGACDCCGYQKVYGATKIRVHVHHLRKSHPPDNSRRNLALLCSVCHRQVHAILDAAEATQAGAWVLNHYPGGHR